MKLPSARKERSHPQKRARLLRALVSATLMVVDPPSVDAGEGPGWSFLLIGRAGFFAGVAAGLVLMALERRRTVLDLRLGRDDPHSG